MRETVPAKDAGVRYTPDDVQKALDDAPQDKWGDPVDHRNGKPLLLENINGDRGWEMRWDPDGKGWVAENRGQGGDHGLPAKGEPGSYGYDAKGRRLPFANHRPEYAPGQVQEVWDRSRTSLINRIRGGELELPEPTQSNQTWVRVRDNADGPELVDLGESKGKWKLIEWDPDSPRKDVWDMGHISEAKYSTLREEYLSGQITEERFLRQYHEARNYEVQDPGRNRSHDDE